MDLKKANQMAVFASLVYSDYDVVLNNLRDQGITDWAWFDNDGTQAFACRKHKSNEILIVFRGTEPDQMKDILADLKAWRKPAREKGLVHFGFAQALDKVYDSIVQWISEQKLGDEYQITCTAFVRSCTCYHMC